MRNVIPEANLQFAGGVKGAVLFDSGALTNLITEQHMRRIGAVEVQGFHGSFPTFIMADGKRARPQALVEFYLELPSDKRRHSRFFSAPFVDKLSSSLLVFRPVTPSRTSRSSMEGRA